MTREQIIERRTRRIKCLASIIYEAIKDGDEYIWLKDLSQRFPLDLRFGIIPQVHQFVNSMPLTLEKPGQGKGKSTGIKIDHQSLKFVSDKLRLSVIELLEISKPAKRTPGTISKAEFLRRFEDIPDFTPMGDPDFTLTCAPRI